MTVRRVLPRALLATGLAAAATVMGSGTASAAGQEVIVFDKGDGPTSGALIFKVDGVPKDFWRAGSGNGSSWNNDCASNRGHLPNGRYSTVFHSNYAGSLIHGRAVRLSDKVCSAGTVTRTALFIHSEQTVDNTQGTTEGTRWDGDGDYKSEGCVKLHPNDIAELFWNAYAYGGADGAVLDVVS